MTRRSILKPQLAGIITGASTGIGRALAVELAKRFSARLVLNARNQQLLIETAELVKASGGQAIVQAGDIAQESVVKRLSDLCLDNYGQIDLLVNNAGLARPGPVASLTTADWRYVFDINVFGALQATYAVLPQLLKQGSGKIVNVASVAGKVAFPGSVCYSASKFALTGMSEGMAAELYPSGIDVITVCPGWVRSEFFSNNQVPDQSNPTIIAETGGWKGFIMRNWLSISSEQTAVDIIRACQRGGPQEIILTGPGVIIERLMGMFPGLVFRLCRKIPANRLQAAQRAP